MAVFSIPVIVAQATIPVCKTCLSSSGSSGLMGETLVLTTGEADTIIRRSTYSLAGQPVAVRVSVSGTAVDDVQPGLTYLHTDHLGSIRALSDENGDQVGTDIDYEPFGAFRSGAATLAGVTDRAYTGHRSNNLPDDDLGLLYMNARFYLPGTGRFASADTIVPDPADPQSLNRYSYGLNNPLKYRDLTGYCAVDPYDSYSDYDCWAEYYFLSDIVRDNGYDVSEYLGSGEEWDLLGIERNENHLQNVYEESEEWNHNFDGFLQGYAMYHIYYGDPDLAFDHEVITVVDEKEEPLSTYWAKIFSEDVLFSPYTPYGDEQYMAAIDAANEAGDIERALTISVMWTSGVQEGQTPLPEIGRSSTPHFIEAFREWIGELVSGLFD